MANTPYVCLRKMAAFTFTCGGETEKSLNVPLHKLHMPESYANDLPLTHTLSSCAIISSPRSVFCILLFPTQNVQLDSGKIPLIFPPCLSMVYLLSRRVFHSSMRAFHKSGERAAISAFHGKLNASFSLSVI